MLRWIKARLRRWLLDDQPRSIRFVVRNQKGQPQIHEAVPRAAVGLMLQVEVPGVDVRLVGPEQCADQGTFWAAWNRLNEGVPPLRWEDGTPFQPPEQ
jgi:hypothetical protein